LTQRCLRRAGWGEVLEFVKAEDRLCNSVSQFAHPI